MSQAGLAVKAVSIPVRVGLMRTKGIRLRSYHKMLSHFGFLRLNP